MEAKVLAQYIDHTYLKSEGTKKHINKLIDEAIEYNFKTICVNPSWIKYAKNKLDGTKIGITTVVGYPLGANCTQVKVFETKLAIDHGADEIDMVINIGKLKDHQDEYVLNEIKKIKEVCGDRILKVIVETALLSKEEKHRIIDIINASNANFIKTSTGFSYGGATVEDIKLMKKRINKDISIKASGKISSLEIFNNMIEAGADRVGSSKSVEIIKELLKGK